MAEEALKETGLGKRAAPQDDSVSDGEAVPSVLGGGGQPGLSVLPRELSVPNQHQDHKQSEKLAAKLYFLGTSQGRGQWTQGSGGRGWGERL